MAVTSSVIKNVQNAPATNKLQASIKKTKLMSLKTIQKTEQKIQETIIEIDQQGNVYLAWWTLAGADFICNLCPYNEKRTEECIFCLNSNPLCG